MFKIFILTAICVIVICAVIVFGAVSVKAEDTILEFKDMNIGDLEVDGFELTERGDVEIYSVGAKNDYHRQFFAYGWIIDSKDRETVWSMNNDCDDISQMADALYDCESVVNLAPGKYEAYYYVGEPGIFFSEDMNISIRDLGDLLGKLGDVIKEFDSDKNDNFKFEDADELTFTLRTNASFRRFTPVFDDHERTIVNFNQPDRDEYLTKGFTLSREASLDIYAIGEYSDSYELFVDGGWIINADTRKKVWTMDKWNTDRAGGAKKNRMFRDVITLPAGNYIACYATDDSHDNEGWNMPPPADPMAYGMLITAANDNDFKYVSDYDDHLNTTEIVALTRVGDDEFLKQGFTLNKDAKIHILALGERSYTEGEFADYGWIVDADNMETVWEMDADNVEFAGGAAKNAMFDGIIDLPAGNYMVYYRTDDSHSYEEWNAAAPFQRRSYGITVSGIGDDFSIKDFTLIDQFQPTGNILVNLTGLGNDEDISQDFTLEKTTRIRIMGVGEGKSKTMYDYGWIENDDTHEVVWEMTYRKTRHAGGASKNRKVVSNITLEPGEYTAYFVTDDSHSFQDFNASPPDEPERWGLLITQRE